MDPFSASPVKSLEDFRAAIPGLEAYLTGRWLTDFANFSAFAFHALPDLNWAGFYLFDGETLLLGPFVGKPACTEIRPGRGVCGTAFAGGKALLVPDVHEFPGHIACDSASRSELVLPLFVGGVCRGVLDLDSPSPGRFREEEAAGLELWLKALYARLPPALWDAKPWAR